MPNQDNSELRDKLRNLSVPNIILKSEPKSISTGHLPEEKIDEILSEIFEPYLQKEVEKARLDEVMSLHKIISNRPGVYYKMDCLKDLSEREKYLKQHLTHIKQENT